MAVISTGSSCHVMYGRWSEGRNIIIDYRWGEGHAERFSEIAAEFVQRKVTLILTHNTPPTLAAKQATSSRRSDRRRDRRESDATRWQYHRTVEPDARRRR